MFRTIIFENREISYQISGEGSPVVFLHGYLMSSWVWNELMEELSGEHLVISPDLPGHGRSSDYPVVHSMEFMADAVSAILQHEKIGKTSLIGHSMGGYVALAICERYPGLLKSLLLLNTDAFKDSAEKCRERDRVIQLIRQGKKNLFIRELLREAIPEGSDFSMRSLREAIFNAGIVHSGESLISTTEGIRERMDRSDLLKDPEIPVLWLLGEKDTRINARDVISKADALKLIRPQLIPCGHMSYLENPDIILDKIGELLSHEGD